MYNFKWRQAIEDRIAIEKELEEFETQLLFIDRPWNQSHQPPTKEAILLASFEQSEQSGMIDTPQSSTAKSISPMVIQIRSPTLDYQPVYRQIISIDLSPEELEALSKLKTPVIATEAQLVLALEFCEITHSLEALSRLPQDDLTLGLSSYKSKSSWHPEIYLAITWELLEKTLALKALCRPPNDNFNKEFLNSEGARASLEAWKIARKRVLMTYMEECQRMSLEGREIVEYVE